MTMVNPKTVTVNDPSAAGAGVTSFSFLVGTASGGPYSVATASVPVSTFSVSSGVYTCPWTDLVFAPTLVPFTNYFMVVEAVNAQGASGSPPEVSFSLATVPPAPTSLTLA